MRLSLVLALIVVAALALGLYWLWTPDRSRVALEAAYMDSPDDMIEVDGVWLHVRDSGPREAPALIMLHGFGSSLHTWEPWAEALGDRYRVVRFDIPGTGLSGLDPTGDYSDERTLDVLRALMDRLAIDKATLIGNSMGGRFAWRFAAAHPERVERLVLISPDGFASHGLEYGKRPDVPAMVQLMRYVLPRSMLRMNLVPAYADPLRLSEATVDRYYDLLLAPGARDATIARMGQVELVEPPPLLATITAPTLLLWGEKDAMIPVANAADYQAALPDSRLVVLPDLGHVPHEEAPAEALVPVAAFLDEGRA
ncbi:MAG: alpha/beta hydrolase [Aurantimonas endophytica]|uniref:Pimeloyl-ACP methyl ester carboxylesterase n=1 Tax=Aurantimonas endophytica TaxID=1522175 RepID=A0A7W6HBV4_9HYPH|nr:alpha/beta hydrolase [Aurantimonas endophytica]MBB4002286.1 pimeloyl-ACP methyl ester carboxylesterase [Aurantimonas endophytica]MCO6402090.1 alpha/beta fold hydrolase [Aurantimonas endophytica]